MDAATIQKLRQEKKEDKLKAYADRMAEASEKSETFGKKTVFRVINNIQVSRFRRMLLSMS